MSIAIATICHDGLVLCADQEIGTPDFKFYETKLSRIRLAPGRGEVVLGYGGSPDTMKIIVQNLRGRLENQHKQSQQIEKDLQESLDAALPKNPKESHQILCGFCEAGMFNLLKTYNRKISPVPVWDCVGFGDSALTRYLGAIFLGSYVHLSAYRAVPICDYIVLQAKKYVQGCGGQTDLMLLTPEGRVKEQFGTSTLDRACEAIECNLNRLLTSATEPNVTAEQCQRLIEQFRKVLETQAQFLVPFR